MSNTRATIARLLPKPLKGILRGAYQSWLNSGLYKSYRSIFHPHKSLEHTHEYWRNPGDDYNDPTGYVAKEHEVRSAQLHELVTPYTDNSSAFLEIGCNAGRNLNYLYSKGYKNLTAIEISTEAVNILHQVYPEMGSHATIHNAPVEEVIKNFEDNKFDVVYTMAVLEHIHKDSEWIFKEMVRISNNIIITIEDERDVSWRHFPRNYKKVFEKLGMQQLAETDDVKGLPHGFYARVFKKMAK